MKDFVLTENSFLHLNANEPCKYKKIFQEGKREDIAAAFQKVLENVVTHVVQTNLRKYNLKNVCLAGGVAANVKMNQRIMELPECEEIYIHPGMSDCGTGTGAALIIANQQKRIHSRIPHVYLGPEYTDNEILNTLKKFQFQYSKEENIEKKVAKLLTSNKVVARFNGRMEYGPRSLGNRSILCATGDVTINSWLNQRLNRTEFMPFAPVTLDYMAEKMYQSISKAKYTAEFMTVTVDCTEEMKRISPAAVHIDGTARPQIACKTTNGSLYQILEYYYQMSGIPNLINTSFNIHEEPIVCTPYDALKTFGDGSIDYLAIGDYLVVAPHEIHSTKLQEN